MVNVINACNLTQVINHPTIIHVSNCGKRTFTCIDHIYTNAVDMCSKCVLGYGDVEKIVPPFNRRVVTPVSPWWGGRLSFPSFPRFP